MTNPRCCLHDPREDAACSCPCHTALETLRSPSYDIRSTIGPALDAAIQTARAPGERWAWDISSALVATDTGAIGVQFVVYLVTPSPVLGNTITAIEEVNPLTLLEGNTALDLVRRLIENGRQARSSVLASPFGGR